MPRNMAGDLYVWFVTLVSTTALGDTGQYVRSPVVAGYSWEGAVVLYS